MTEPQPNAGAELSVAMISDVFFDDDPEARLRARLREARELGAELALLPELPCNRWAPATRERRDDDAEEPGGPRHRMQSEAAREVGIGLVGGAIVRDPRSGRRYNTALVFDARGEQVGSFCKCHIPDEPGFREADHYDAGNAPPRVIDAFSMRFGLQICSDSNRPEGSHLLGAMGAEAVLAPRATEQATIDRWRCVFRANALTSCLYVLSVNRPAPEAGVMIGGASIAVSPFGETLVDRSEPVIVVTLDRPLVAKAKTAYPGYLPVRADLYATAWSAVANSRPGAFR